MARFELNERQQLTVIVNWPSLLKKPSLPGNAENTA